MFLNFLCACLSKKLHSGGDAHARCKQISRIAAIILRVWIDAFREQPLHRAIPGCGSFHGKHSLHQESETLAILGFERSAVFETKLSKIGHRSLGGIVQHAGSVGTQTIGGSALFHE